MTEIKNVSTGQGDDCKTGFLLNFAYFKDNYKLILLDLRKQKPLDADSWAIHQITFTGRASADITV